MSASGWLQLALIVLALLAITKPLGLYLVRVLDPEQGGPTFLERFLGDSQPGFCFRCRCAGLKAPQPTRQSQHGRDC